MPKVDRVRRLFGGKMTKQNKISLTTILLLLIAFAVAPQLCNATVITVDLKNVAWDFGDTSESFDLQMLGARGDLTFQVKPGDAAYITGVSTAFSAIEKGLVIQLDDQPTRQLLSMQVDLHFNGASLDINVNTIQVRSFSPDLSATPGIQAVQSFWIGTDPRSDSQKLAQWSRYQNISQEMTSFHFNFADNGSLFNPLTKLPPGFFLPTSDPVASERDPFGFGAADFGDAPEPGSIVLTAAGLGAFILFLRKRNGLVSSLS